MRYRIYSLVIVLALLVGCMSNQKSSLTGIESGQLKACPDRPSCVCSTDTRERHVIEPLRVGTQSENPMQAVAAVVGTFPRVTILEQTPDYMHATFTSKIFRFVDDVEFLLDGDNIQVRSVSRIGHSDFGVNRKRVEAIRAALNAQSAVSAVVDAAKE